MKRKGAAGEAAVPHPARVAVTRRKSNVTAQKPFMNNSARDSADRAVLLEAFVAELTCAAYAVALRHTTGHSWLASSWPCGRRSTKWSRGGDKRARRTGRWSSRPFKRLAHSNGKPLS